MPYQLPLDTLPVIPVLHDTVKVYILKEGFSWDKVLASIVGLIAVAVAVIGWKRNSALARQNQIKAFDEGVLDKIRIDLIPLFTEHREWVLEFRLIVDALTKLNAAYEYNAEHGNPAADPKDSAQRFYRQALGFSEIRPFLEKKNTRKWITRLTDYQDLFKPMIPILEVLDAEHMSIRGDLREFIKKYNDKIPDYVATTNIFYRTTNRLENLDSLRDQFFRFFQYECLKSIERIKAPLISVTPWQDKIIRQPNGSYRIEISQEKKRRAEVEVMPEVPFG